MTEDQLDNLAQRIEGLISTEAPVWEEQFQSGPGLVVGVSDAARVVAQMLAEQPVLATGGAVTSDSFDEIHVMLRSSPCPAEVLSPPRKRRLRACVEAWPDCEEGDYNPACCRFPKSCSANVYDPQYVTEADLEEMK